MDVKIRPKYILKKLSDLHNWELLQTIQTPQQDTKSNKAAPGSNLNKTHQHDACCFVIVREIYEGWTGFFVRDFMSDIVREFARELIRELVRKFVSTTINRNTDI